MTKQENMFMIAMDSYIPTTSDVKYEVLCDEISYIMSNNLQYCDIVEIKPGSHILAKLTSERLIEGCPSLHKSLIFKNKAYKNKFNSIKTFFNSFNDLFTFDDNKNIISDKAIKYNWFNKSQKLLIDNIDIEELSKTYILKSQLFDIMNIVVLLASKGYCIKGNLLEDIMVDSKNIDRSYRIVLYKYYSYDTYMRLKEKRG